MSDSNPEYELKKAIAKSIPISVEINGKKMDDIDPNDICPWYTPPKPKKSWRRRAVKTQRNNGQLP